MKAQTNVQRSLFRLIIFMFAVMLVGCSNNNQTNQQQPAEGNQPTTESQAHEHMDHSSSAEVPENLKAAADPAYPVGSKVLIHANHMSGMQGAEGTVVGAYDTVAYMITYTPTTGGPKVEHHKWVVQEELMDAGRDQLEPGTEVKLNASHMKGMEGAAAVIESAEPSTVYMLDYVPTTGGEEVKNHKWVTEGELSAK